MGLLDDTTTARIADDDATEDERPSLHLPHEVTRGTAIGRYVVIKRLGVGGMGVVYLAFDGHLDRRVALKVLRTDAGVGPDGAARLLREAQVMARLAHPNVVAIFDVGALDAGIFIAMEYVKGPNLRQWRARGERSPRAIVEMFARAGEGLAAAHAQSILHRDFKPENVVVDERGRPRVLDFGLARADAAGDAKQIELLDTLVNAKTIAAAPLTEQGAIMGTPAYMAPEQLRGEAIDSRADQFAFCVALYESLYGVRPFPGRTIRELRAAIEEGRIQPQPRGNRTPGAVFEVLARGLRAKVDERWPDMGSLIVALERASDATRRKLRWLLGAGALLALLASVGVASSRASRPDPCKGSERAFGGVWDPPVRAAVATAFRASANANAEDSLQRVTRALDEYSSAWTAASTEACMDTRVRGVQSDEALDLRTACLRERLEDERALTSFLRTADSTLVDNALGTVRKLPSLRDCEDVKALRATFTPVPLDKKVAVESLRHDISDVVSRNNAARCDDVRGLASSVADRSAAIGYVPVQAQALYWQAQVAARCISAATASDLLIRAAKLALESHQDEIVAESLIALARDLTSIGRFPEAEAYGDLAEGAVRRIGAPDLLLADLAKARGILAYTRGNLQLAQRFGHEALDAHVRATGGDDPATLDFEARLTDLSYEAGALQETLESQLDLAHRASETLGPGHFRTARFELDVAETLIAQGKYREGRPWLEKARSTASAATRADQIPFDDAVLDLGNGDVDAGFAAMAALARAQEGTHGPNDVWPLSTRADLAKWLAVHRRFSAALDVVDPLIRQLEQLGERDTTWYANAYAARALVLARTHGGERALADAQHAATVAERAAAQLPFALLAEGDVLLTLGKRDEAAGPLERARALAAGRGGIDAIVMGDIDQALARAAPERARSLRQDAATAYRSSREPAFANAVVVP